MYNFSLDKFIDGFLIVCAGIFITCIVTLMVVATYAAVRDVFLSP